MNITSMLNWLSAYWIPLSLFLMYLVLYKDVKGMNAITRQVAMANGKMIQKLIIVFVQRGDFTANDIISIGVLQDMINTPEDEGILDDMLDVLLGIVKGLT